MPAGVFQSLRMLLLFGLQQIKQLVKRAAAILKHLAPSSTHLVNERILMGVFFISHELILDLRRLLV